MLRARLPGALILASLLLLSSATAAPAQWLVTPYGGVTWGTSATFNDAALSYDDEFAARTSLGAAAGWRSGPLVLEFDFGYLPQLFANRTANDDFEFGSSRVLTLMANGLYSAPFHVVGLQPYGAAGIGMIRTHINDQLELFTVESSNTAFNIGGGVTKPLGGRYGLRADARYFRTIQEKLPEREVDVTIGALKFWRFTGGVTIRF